MGEADVLAAAEARADAIRVTEAETLLLAYQWAILHGPDRLDPDEAGKPGRNLRPMAGPTTLPRHLPVARSPRRLLPHRPHRTAGSQTRPNSGERGSDRTEVQRLRMSR